MAVAVPPETAAGVPPHNEEAEASVLGAILLTEQALDGVLLEVGLRPHDFYRPRHAAIFQAMIRLKEKATPEAVDALTVAEELRRSSELDKAGGEGYLHSLPDRGAGRGRGARLRAHRQGALAAPERPQGHARDPGRRGRTPRRRPRPDRAGRGRPVQDRARRRQLGDAVARGDPARRDRQARGAVEDRRRAHGHALRLRGPRCAHRRLPARQPDRARRAPLDGKERGRHQHRRVRGRGGGRAGGAVLARDVRDRARAPLPGLPGARVERRPAQGPRARGEVAEGAEGGREARPGADLRRRLQRHERARAAREVAPAGCPPRPRPGGRGLPPADAAGGPPRQQPRRADRPDQPRPQDPGPRARRPGDRGLTALPRGGVPQPAGARCCRTFASRAASSRTPTS